MIILYILLHLIPILISWLRGIYISAQTAKSDYPSTSWIWLYKRITKNYDTCSTAISRYNDLSTLYTDKPYRQKIMNNESFLFDRWDLWYIGGNDYYPRPDAVLYMNKNDFWHRCRTIWASLIAYNTFICFLLGMIVASYGFIYGFTIWVILDIILLIIIAISSAGIQEITFSRVYGRLLNYEKNQELDWKIKLICWIVNDYKFPTYAESQNYRGRTT